MLFFPKRLSVRRNDCSWLGVAVLILGEDSLPFGLGSLYQCFEFLTLTWRGRHVCNVEVHGMPEAVGGTSVSGIAVETGSRGCIRHGSSWGESELEPHFIYLILSDKRCDCESAS